MINNMLIRIKVIQIVFATTQQGTVNLDSAEKELRLSFQYAYDLYFRYLLLVVEITNLYEKQVALRKNKFLPTPEDLNPNMKLVNNQFAKQLIENNTLQAYVNEHGLPWENNLNLLKTLLNHILDSEKYQDYLKEPADSYRADRDFWADVFLAYIAGNQQIAEVLEDVSIYWNDDITTAERTVLNTIRRFSRSSGKTHELLPMFGSQDAEAFAVTLFRQAVINGKEYQTRIEKHLKKRTTERVANMDLVILQVALAELINFTYIPVRLTINEYVEIAKYYSSPQSTKFVNAVLDALVKELKLQKTRTND
jgi:N utilization substance protein B